jgi:hypothetical protein
LAYNRQQRREAIDWYMALKTGRPCADCDESFHPAAMQWDHLPGVVKVADVGQMYQVDTE